MSSFKEDKENKTPKNVDDDDITSLRTLEFELSEYLDRNNSTAYHELYPGVETIDYDFVAERKNIYSTNLVESTAHFIKGCLGAGILGIHEAYMYGGIWTSLLVTIIFGFLISYCMSMLVRCAQTMYIRLRVPRLSYPDLAEVALATGPSKLRRFSRAFRYIVDIFLFLDFNGTCCIFQIVIAKTLKERKKRKKKERNREYQRAWRQRKKDLKKKDSKEEKEEEKRKRHRVNQRAYYRRTKGLKEHDKNVEKLFQKKLHDLQMKRKKLDSNEDQENVVQCRASQNLENVLEATSNWSTSMSIYILIVTVPLIAICLIRSLKYLAPFSLVADLIIALCVLTTMSYSLSMATDLKNRRAWKSIHGFFNMLGVCIYSINGIGVTLPIENNMRKPQYFNIVLQCGMPIVVSFVMIIGFFGYWAWGENCRSPFTIHMPSYLSLLIMQGLLTITLGVTFAVHFWVPFRIIWHYVGKLHDKYRSLWERVYRALYVLLISCLSIALPNIVTWMSFLGNFFTAFMVFIFPALIEILITWKEPRKWYLRWSLLKNISLIVLGVVICGGGFFINLIK